LIAAALLQHPDPERYLLSGALQASLEAASEVSSKVSSKVSLRGTAGRGAVGVRARGGSGRPSPAPEATPFSSPGFGRNPQDLAVGFLDAGFPDILRHIPDPPVVLYLRGDPALLGEPSVAVVGARRCTAQGRANARALAGQLAQLGIQVVSGLALGVDGAAHSGVLAARRSGLGGEAKTIAVLGGGLRQLYPRRHGQLAAQIIDDGGLLVSEYAHDMPPLAHQFPERNRIISGLSMATVVVEASLNSGSLITARYAAEQGRDVFAMPGPVNNTVSQGCHRLIQQGAGLVAHGKDVLLNIGIEGIEDIEGTVAKLEKNSAPAQTTASRSSVAEAALSAPARRVLALIQGYPMTLDELIIDSGLQASRLTTLLVDLELAGFVQQGPLGYSRSS
jgi:DNA processing protein